jgi:hypothetical protein
MDPRAQAAMQSFMQAMSALDMEYIALMQRCGVRRFQLHRI